MKVSKRMFVTLAGMAIEAGIVVVIAIRPEASADLAQITMWVATLGLAYVGGDSYRTSGSSHAAHKAPTFPAGSGR